MKRPDLKDVSDEVKSYISFLEKIKDDNFFELYDALRNKLKDMAEEINNADIDLSESTDKSFDRLVKAMVESRSIVENIKFLKSELGLLNQDDKVNEKSFNPMEARAKSKMIGKK